MNYHEKTKAQSRSKNSLCFGAAFIFLFSYTLSSQNSTPKKVLFIGNSYTYVNNLPQLLSDLASSANDSVSFDSNTPGGSNFQSHTVNSTTMQKISSQNWDYVVLQAQSQEPAADPTTVQNNTYPFAKILNDSIKSNNFCTETVFYMTWGRKNGDAAVCPTYTPVCTFDGMQNRLRSSYLEMADSNLATTAPVGMAFKYCRQQFPSIDLYQPDESHPSLEGSYLAACVFYSVLFQKSPIGLSFISTLTSTDATSLQNIAHQTVFDSLALWRINANHSDPIFTYSQLGLNYQFNSNTSSTTVWLWNFGDGNFSALQNPNHTYASAGNYTVSLKTSNICYTDSSVQIVNSINSIFEKEKNPFENQLFYPNPSNGKIYFTSAFKDFFIEVYNTLGNRVINQKILNSSMDVSQLSNGLYLIRIINNDRVYNSTLLLDK